MSTDAREAWQQKAADWVAFVLSAHVTALASGDRSELDEELDNLQKHLRTTPEGYALVKVDVAEKLRELVDRNEAAHKQLNVEIERNSIFAATKGAE